MTHDPITELEASRAAVQALGDLDPAFFALWLDDSLALTCARFVEEGEHLETAQRRQLDTLLEQARLPGEGRLLALGCGRGALARRAAVLHPEVQVVEWHRPFGGGRPQGHRPEGLHDALVVVGEDGLDRGFFQRCHGWLEPGGRLVLQAIAEGHEGLAALTQAWDGLFEARVVLNESTQHVRTLRSWLRRLKAHHAEAAALVGEEAVAAYQRYLRLDAIVFAQGRRDLLQITLQRLEEVA